MFIDDQFSWVINLNVNSPFFSTMFLFNVRVKVAVFFFQVRRRFFYDVRRFDNFFRFYRMSKKLWIMGNSNLINAFKIDIAFTIFCYLTRLRLVARVKDFTMQMSCLSFSLLRNEAYSWVFNLRGQSLLTFRKSCHRYWIEHTKLNDESKSWLRSNRFRDWF